jgi:LysM repeat protein
MFLFIIIVIAMAISLLLGQDLLGSPAAILANPTPLAGPTPTIAPLAVATPGLAAQTSFRSVALGFSLEYPARWRKKESSLWVMFAPSPTALETTTLGAEPLIWLGISADNRYQPADILATILADFPANTKSTHQSSTTLAGITWTLTELTFTPANLAQPALARVAVSSHNEVGYFAIVIAPVARWAEVESVFQELLQSFRFTQQAVIRPTDANPLPTPTPSPTPRIYIVQPGDTLGGIAAEFDVTIEALVTRNNLEDARLIRSGQKLIIPNKRKK